MIATQSKGREKQGGEMLFRAFDLAAFVAAFALLTALPLNADTFYSGVTVNSDGSVSSYGVTDACSMLDHITYMNSTLTSPNGRQASGNASDGCSTEVDLYLAFDATDLGTYTVISHHWAWCPVAHIWFWNGNPSQGSGNNAPSSLIPYNYGTCAPNGVGPLQVLKDANVVDCSGKQRAVAFDGVARNLVYQLINGAGIPFPAAYTIYESFSNFQKNPSNSGLPQPTASNWPIAAGGLVTDCQFAGYTSPGALGSNEHASYTQNFSVAVSGITYPLSTTVSISLGNFNGTPEDNVTITTP